METICKYLEPVPYGASVASGEDNGVEASFLTIFELYRVTFDPLHAGTNLQK